MGAASVAAPMPLPKALRRLAPDRVRDDPRLRALAVGTGVIPPRTMHSAGEAALLADLARGRRRVVEIGVFEGSSAVVLCDVLDPGAELHLVDPFGHHAERAARGRGGDRVGDRRVVERAVRRARRARACTGTSTSARASPERWDAAGRPRVHRRRPQRGRRREGLGPVAPVRRRGRRPSLFHDARASQPGGRGLPGPTAVVDRLFRGPRRAAGWEIAREVDRAVAVRYAPRAA